MCTPVMIIFFFLAPQAEITYIIFSACIEALLTNSEHFIPKRINNYSKQCQVFNMLDRLHELQPDEDLNTPLITHSPSSTSSSSSSSEKQKQKQKQIHKQKKKELTNYPTSSPIPQYDVETQSNTILTDFFSTVNLIKEDLEFIRSTSVEIGRIKSDALTQTPSSSSNSQKNKMKSGQLGKMVSHTNQIASQCKFSIQQLRSQLTASSHKDERTLQIRSNVVNALTRKFIDVMKEYSSAQSAYKTQAKSTAIRQVKIVQPNSTDEEIERMLQRGDSSDLAKQTILKASTKDGKLHSDIQNTYEEVKGKYYDVIVLEASIMELSRMFEEFAMMVEEQSELIDNIEFQVLAAKDYIEDGLQSTIAANKLQKKIRKKRCCVILVSIGIVAVLVGFMHIR